MLRSRWCSWACRSTVSPRRSTSRKAWLIWGASRAWAVIVVDEAHIEIVHETDIVTARQKARELAAKVGFTTTDQTLIALAISEIARNIISYAQRGEVTLGRTEDGGRRGVVIVARDEGPGIPDI